MIAVEIGSNRKALERAGTAGHLAHAVPAESETPDQNFKLTVYELLHQAFDAFGLGRDGKVTRVINDLTGKTIEHLELERKGDRGRLDLTQPQYGKDGRDIYLSNLQASEIHATYMVADGRADGPSAISLVYKTLVDSSVLTKPKP